MSEKRYKRFYVSESENQLTIYDNGGLDDYYHLGNDERDVKGICNLLNSLNKLEEENETLRKQVKSFETTMNATSDYNAYLESKITTLEKENEKLRKELNDCEKFRYQVFKRMEELHNE